jgi:hypothetical protein
VSVFAGPWLVVSGLSGSAGIGLSVMKLNNDSQRPISVGAQAVKFPYSSIWRSSLCTECRCAWRLGALGPRRFISIAITLVLCMAVQIQAQSASGTIYCLPFKAVDVAPQITLLLQTCVDSALRTDYTVVKIDTNSIPPDSNICSGEITMLDSTTIYLRFELFLRNADSVISVSTLLDSKTISSVTATQQIESALRKHSSEKFPLSRVQILGTRGSEVFINQVISDHKVPFETFLPAGSYSIAVIGKRLLKKQFILELDWKKDTSVVVDFWRLSRPIRYTLFSSSLLLMGSALYFNMSQHRDYSTYLSCESDYDTHYRRYQRALVARNTSYALSGIFFVTGFFITLDIPFRP